MNDKDKLAFEKWFKDEFGKNDLPLPLMEHTWQAALEYRDEHPVIGDAYIWSQKFQRLDEKLQKERERSKKLLEALDIISQNQSPDYRNIAHNAIAEYRAVKEGDE